MHQKQPGFDGVGAPAHRNDLPTLEDKRADIHRLLALVDDPDYLDALWKLARLAARPPSTDMLLPN